MPAKLSILCDKSRYRIEFLSILLAAYFTVALNDSLWEALLQSQSGASATERWAFIFILSVAVLSIQAAVLSLLLWGRAFKIAGVIVTIVAAAAHFYTNRYGIIFDTGMIRNVLATNPSEARELLTVSFLGSVIAYSAPPLVLIALYPNQNHRFVSHLPAKLISITISLVIAISVIAANFKTLASTIRNYGHVRHLIIPTSPLVSFARVLGANTAESSVVKKELDPRATRRQTLPQSRKQLTVVVVGETVRAQNWGLSNYGRNTTPSLSKIDRTELFNFPYAIACGTSTEVSLPCMFSDKGRGEGYDEKEIRRTESVLALLYKIGVGVTWIDNQSGCKGVCDGIPTFEAKQLGAQATETFPSDFDENLIRGFEQAVSASPTDQIIVLHMIGNHGPAYSKRYPKQFSVFKPVCNDNNLGNCDQASIINAYDNAIVYTDFINSQLINRLSRFRDRSVSLIYVSDHGESLGEKGLYLHGAPYRIAPDEQLRVPFFFWIPRESQRYLKLNTSCLSQLATKPTSHNLLSHTLLGIYNVESERYLPHWDYLRQCRD